jgi:hypothetical protein
MAPTEALEVAQKTSPVRLSAEAIRLAKIASGYTGESMADYVSRTIEERAAEDIERLHAEMKAAAKKEPKPKTKP